jgi:integrase/recombinase XerD
VLLFDMEKTMPQAKILTKAELRRVLDHIATRPHAKRNRAMLLLTHWAGLRAKEVAALRIADVIDNTGNVKEEIYLSAEQTKGKHSRTVYVCSKLRKELADYVATLSLKNRDFAFFPSQKNPKRGFSQTTITQYFFHLYRDVGIEGASSHSGRRTYLTTLANKGTAIHLLKAIAGHRNISTTAVYLYSSPAQLKAAVELV